MPGKRLCRTAQNRSFPRAEQRIYRLCFHRIVEFCAGTVKIYIVNVSCIQTGTCKRTFHCTKRTVAARFRRRHMIRICAFTPAQKPCKRSVSFRHITRHHKKCGGFPQRNSVTVFAERICYFTGNGFKRIKSHKNCVACNINAACNNCIANAAFQKFRRLYNSTGT